MKGVILVAGKGTRLYPITKVIPKGLLPIYDRPMIYFALDFMKSVDIEEVLVVVSSETEDIFRKSLGDGSEFGLKIDYRVQKEINGTGGALREVKDFFEGDSIVLYYGDNILLSKELNDIAKIGIGNLGMGKASMLALEVANPSNYGVIETDLDDNVVHLEEKPLQPKSNFVSTGIYFYPADIALKLNSISMSPRGEYEITDVNESYLEEGRLKAIKLSRETSWFDAGDVDALLEAGNTYKKFVSEK